MLDLSSFRTRFPEFITAPDPLVSAHLARAEARIDPDVWGDKTNDGHGYLTAHMLSLSQSGQMARVDAKDGTRTLYGDEHQRLERQVTICLRVF